MNDTVKKAFGDNQDINNALNNEYFKEAIYAGAIQWGGKNGAKKLVIPVLKQAQEEGKLGDTMYLLDLFYENRKKQPRKVTNQYSYRKVPDLDEDGREQKVFPFRNDEDGKPVIKTKDEKYVSGKDMFIGEGVIMRRGDARRRLAIHCQRSAQKKT